MTKLFERGVAICSWSCALLLLTVLFILLGYLGYRGGAAIDARLIFGSTTPLDGLLLQRQVFDGLFPAIAGTFALVVLAVGLAAPVGLAAGIYLAEYCRGRSRRLLSQCFDILAGLPSIVVGLAGFSLTLALHRLLPGRLGPCLLSSAVALGFLILPYLIRSTQLALESLPPALRFSAPALGASTLQNIRYVLLPAGLPAILSGIILAIGRAAEDTAVIMLTGAVASAGLPRSLFEQFEALPFFIYYISSQYSDPGELQTGFGAALLLLVVCAMLLVGAFLMEQALCRWFRR